MSTPSAPMTPPSSQVRQSGDYFNTFISAMKMEGSYLLKKPCYDDPPSDACQIGCPWMELVPQQIIAVSSFRHTLSW